MEGAPDVVIENLCSMYPLVNFCGSRGFLVSDLEHGDFSSAPRTPTAGLLWENVSTISVVGSEEWMSPGKSTASRFQDVNGECNVKYHCQAGGKLHYRAERPPAPAMEDLGVTSNNEDLYMLENSPRNR